MNNFEFLQYDPVVGEKFLGIATVRAWGRIILRYKIVPGKEGKGFFASTASIKNGERYESAFMLDSNYENQLLQALIKDKVSSVLNGEKSSPGPNEGPSAPPCDEDCPF